MLKIADSEETLILAEESRSKMILKQQQPEVAKLKIKPVDYKALNQLAIDFDKRFVPQTELSAEQIFWSKTSPQNVASSSCSTPVITEVPKELPKVSMVNSSIEKLKFHLASFDNVVKQRITPTAITEGEWGFEHTKRVFIDEIIPFLKTLKDIFDTFNQTLIDELSEVQTVFNQMDKAMEQNRLASESVKIESIKVLNTYDRLLEQVMFHEIMDVAVHNSVNVNSYVAMTEFQNVSAMFVEKCQRCLQLESELSEKINELNKLSTRFSNLEKHCISLEVSNQLNQELFQIETTCVNQDTLEIPEYFELHNLKAQIQEKDTVIQKLKNHIKDLRKNPDLVKKEYDEVETINIELEHSVAKLLSLNE